ncbi:hypothetical protein BV898_05977 [Hypsibius exemplaris]|uniref:Bulb-type lectin domain-containing protein n=1 Tax=Hypsibius exemplaris TaxID=2072580 RepID=A0A1W0WXX8_HYPEX|nr:hypothetical protein BV898_05977 [Hypsibius exemplaris]
MHYLAVLGIILELGHRNVAQILQTADVDVNNRSVKTTSSVPPQWAATKTHTGESGNTKILPVSDTTRRRLPTFFTTRKKTTVPRRHGIHPGESLWKGQSIWSENGHFELTLQLNGDIVIVRKCDDKVIWWTNTKVQLQTAAASMRLHHNGSAALYGDGGEVVWHFPTDWVQFAGSVVRLDNATGSLCLFKNRTCVWLSGGAGPCKPKKDKEIRKTIVLEPGSSLARNVALWSDNGKCHLTSNDCGDIVLTRLCDGAKMWSLGKEKNNSFWICDAEYDDIEVQELILDQDGTLKAQARCFGWLLGINMTVTRILGKSLTSKAKLLLGNDCRLCLFENGRCYWLSGTFHNFCITSARNTTSQPSFTQAADFDADDLNSMPETNSGANSAQLSSTPHLSVTETSRAEFRRYELRPNESLWQGQSIWSRDGQIQLTLQLDGNLVIRRKCDDTIVWAMNRKKHMQPAASMRLHHNGSIALYSTEDGLAVGKLPTDWEEFEGSVLRLDDATGSLCLFKNGTCVWLSGGAGLCRVKAEENIERGIVLLTSGSTLGKNTSFWSVNKECMLTWNDQDDLRLFRSCDGAEIWSFDIRMEWVSVNVLGEQLESLSICHWSEEEEQDLILQHDGSLIIRATCAKKTKNTHRIVTGIIGKARTSAAKLMLGNDCRLCLFEDGGCYWSSSSYHNYCFASPRQTTSYSITGIRIRKSATNFRKANSTKSSRGWTMVQNA